MHLTSMPDILHVGDSSRRVAGLAMPPARREPDCQPPAGLIRHALRVVLTGVAFTGFFFGAALLGSVVLQLVRLGQAA